MAGDEDVIEVDEGEDQVLRPLAFNWKDLHELGRKVLENSHRPNGVMTAVLGTSSRPVHRDLMVATN